MKSIMFGDLHLVTWSCTQGHLERVGEERCAFVRAMVFANRAMATRANLEREARNWINAEGTTPPGNGRVYVCLEVCLEVCFQRLLSSLLCLHVDSCRMRKAWHAGWLHICYHCDWLCVVVLHLDGKDNRDHNCPSRAVGLERPM